jgi:uncharacterized protein (TIGR01777 family)
MPGNPWICCLHEKLFQAYTIDEFPSSPSLYASYVALRNFLVFWMSFQYHFSVPREGNMHVLVSGASGLIGSALVRRLESRGSSVLRLVRRQQGKPGELPFPEEGKAPQISGLTAAIHLAGAGIASHRWTAAYKQEILESRVRPTRRLAEWLASQQDLPQLLICASAIGIYGDRGDEVLTEDAAAGDGFLAETCQAWEAAAQPARDAGIRTVHLRFGIVLAAQGGALAKMLPAFRLGLGGRLGSGKQWMSWVALEDVLRTITFVMENSAISGPVNTTAPHPVTNAAFTHALASVLHRPALLPVPAFALRMALGEMADEGLLASTRAVPQKLEQAGFLFACPHLHDALSATLKRE